MSCVQGFPSSTTGGAPGWQVPAPSQTSSPLHAFPSAHEAPAAAGKCTGPRAGSHVSRVHGFPSSTTGGAPGRQAPAPSHVSAPLHAFPSLHDVPAGAGSCRHTSPAHVSRVQGSPSSQVEGVHGTDASASASSPASLASASSPASASPASASRASASSLASASLASAASSSSPHGGACSTSARTVAPCAAVTRSSTFAVRSASPADAAGVQLWSVAPVVACGGRRYPHFTSAPLPAGARKVR